MAEALSPCCRKTLDDFRRRVRNACTSYPVIKDVPCEVCRKVLKFRMYRPDEASEPEERRAG
ncbi:MAG: hypothetical protein KatS3mg076_1284 [Candidatus Binatia bacterium]|nr:MAG: hypothetical protein KatS3mg076_1284 [Candidatus Binatia bacterium]